MDLTDTVGVVTGASSGLGLHLARKLAARGVDVFGLARRTEVLRAVRDEIGPRFHPVTCDVREEEQVAQAFDSILDDAGRIDVLVNNAGLAQFGPVDELSVDDWDVQHETNLRGVFLCTRAAVPTMKAQNAEDGFGGHVVNIASIAGLLGNPNLGAYNASKFGVRGFSLAMMKELREDGIKVTCIYPGSIATEFFDVAGTTMTDNPLQPEDVADTVLDVLETADNHLISEIVMRPLRPRG